MRQYAACKLKKEPQQQAVVEAAVVRQPGIEPGPFAAGNNHDTNAELDLGRMFNVCTELKPK